MNSSVLVHVLTDPYTTAFRPSDKNSSTCFGAESSGVEGGQTLCERTATPGSARHSHCASAVTCSASIPSTGLMASRTSVLKSSLETASVTRPPTHSGSHSLPLVLLQKTTVCPMDRQKSSSLLGKLHGHAVP